MHLQRALAIAGALGIFARPLAGQDTSRAAPAVSEPVRQAAACAGQRIDDIVVHSLAPTAAALRRIPLLAEIVRSVHVNTRPELVRRFLLLQEGQPCSELRRAESERILRAQPFLADATILVYPSELGGVDVEVRTIDETSTIVGGSVKSASPFVTALRVGNSNLGGNGVYLAGKWRRDAVFRDSYGVRFVDYQFTGRPYILTLDAQQEPLGNAWRIEAGHPFLTDFQRLAWRARTGSSNDLVYFEPVPEIVHGLRLRREFFDLGGMVRIGPPGRLSLFGTSFSGEREQPAQTPVLVTPVGLADDTSSVLRNRYAEHRISRVNALWGVRDIEFVRVRGFDALDATQDVPVGFQLGTLFGRSLTVLGSHDDDIFMSADLYMGVAAQRVALRVQLQGEGRRSNDDSRWDGILTSGRIAHYIKLTSTHTFIGSAEWSGGWRQRTPFALTLGANPGGVRGYGRSSTPGGQRAVVRAENRFLAGRPFGLGDAGVAIFADAGRLFAGDVPYGRATSVQSSVGIGLLAAVPPRSARLWRLDLAVPLGTEARGRRVEIRITSFDRTAFFWREPSDIEGARERTVPSSIFSWP